MTIEQYSTLCRTIGFLEGIGTVLEKSASSVYYDAIAVLSDTIDEIWKEAQNG